jgi:hypothetical protein
MVQEAVGVGVGVGVVTGGFIVDWPPQLVSRLQVTRPNTATSGIARREMDRKFVFMGRLRRKNG